MTTGSECLFEEMKCKRNESVRAGWRERTTSDITGGLCSGTKDVPKSPLMSQSSPLMNVEMLSSIEEIAVRRDVAAASVAIFSIILRSACPKNSAAVPREAPLDSNHCAPV